MTGLRRWLPEVTGLEFTVIANEVKQSSASSALSELVAMHEVPVAR
jgi:hypothetical protein